MLLLGAVLTVSSDRSTAERHAEEKGREIYCHKIRQPQWFASRTSNRNPAASAIHLQNHPTTALECKQNHSLVQTLGLNGILHEIRLRDNRRDGQTDRHRHATKRLRVLRELLVATAHVAGIEIRVCSHGREVKRVDAGLGEHQDADAGRLPPDAV